MIDHHCYVHNLSGCEIKAWKKVQAWMGFEPMTPVIPVQCWLPTELSSQLGAGHFVSL